MKRAPAEGVSGFVQHIAATNRILEEPILGSRAGHLVGLEAIGVPRVDVLGNTAGPVHERRATVLDARTRQEAVARRQKAVLFFKNGDPRQPFVMGLIQEPSTTSLLDALLESPPEASRHPTGAHVDGKRVVIEDVVKEMYLESRATDTHSSKGVSVECN